MESSEELRETLVSLRRDNERLRVETMHASLLWRALESLLQIRIDDDPFPGVFDSMRSVFAFEQAMVLAEAGEDRLRCIVAVPSELIGIGWKAGPFLKRVTAGRVSVTFANHELEEWRDLPRQLLSPAQPALYLPIRVRDRRGVLVLLRSEGSAGFDRNHVTLARKFALLASHALAARDAGQTEAESQRLRHLMEQLRLSEQNAQRNADLLNEIVNLLPIGLTVCDEAGRFILVNDAAAADLGRAATDLVGAPAAEICAGTVPSVHALRESGRIEPGHVCSSEENVVTARGARTFLNAVKPVRIFDETLLLSTSLDITARKQVEEELARRAYYDDLTGLPNRALIQERVETAMRHDGGCGRFALAFVDLDNFKHINDYYSHAIGDAVLVAVAGRIAGGIRASDVLARISGDEFVLLFDPLDADEQLRAAIDRILDELKQPFHVEGFEIFTSASIGVSLYPDHGTDYEALRRNADSAMYRGKSGAKGNATFFDQGMGQAVTARMELEQRLRLAIRDRRFCCAFQPKVDIRNGAIVGFEALSRWRDESGVIHAPQNFIGVAIELGLIDQITDFVLADAAAAIPQLDRHFGAHTTISINVAAKQAGDPRFMKAFSHALAATGRADRFMLELTEDAFVLAGQFQSLVLPALRDMGVRVSIDDFGTGYSSLSALADITADEIKVDRSFITSIHQRPRSQSVLKAIESLSRTLGMVVVAEGVETCEELAYLDAATRIRVVQGYYFARPMFLEDLVTAPIDRARARARRSANPPDTQASPDLEVA